jgi:hypothetical protein
VIARLVGLFCSIPRRCVRLERAEQVTGEPCYLLNSSEKCSFICFRRLMEPADLHEFTGERCLRAPRRPWCRRRASSATPTSVCWREWLLTGNFRGDTDRPELAANRLMANRRFPTPLLPFAFLESRRQWEILTIHAVPQLELQASYFSGRPALRRPARTLSSVCCWNTGWFDHPWNIVLRLSIESLGLRLSNSALVAAALLISPFCA